ncbi:Ammonium transporter [Lachnospiraceae bacterium TWA4]|nr:Ammonium transporter [Lachnospiraceae bacterium TWA4]
MDISGTMMMEVNENTHLGSEDYEHASKAKKDAAIQVIQPTQEAQFQNIQNQPTQEVQPQSIQGVPSQIIAQSPMNKVVIIAKLSRYDHLKKAMNDLGVTGMTVTQVMGCGVQKGAGKRYRGVEMDVTLLPKVKVEVVVGEIPVDRVIEAAKKALYTGHIGDGKIFVYPVERVVKIRTGEEDLEALLDVE